jgi:NADH-quinone oxidoreductase E subunit
MGTCNCKTAWDELNEVIEAHRGQESALIEVLHKAQEIMGYLPRDVQEAIAEGLHVPLNKVYGVVSFYHHFSVEPKGKYQVAVCNGTACYVKGAPAVISGLEEALGIKAGETTEDGKFSLAAVRCLGACSLAPVMTINQKAYGLVDADKAREILKQYE